MTARGWIGTLILFGALGGVGWGLYAWKKKAMAASSHAPAYEPMEKVTAAIAREQAHRESTTAIGTVLALRSVTLRNELAGTVRKVALVSGKIAEEGEVLVVLDVAVEEAELKAQQAQAALAETSLARMEKAVKNKAASELELDRAKAEHDVALAQVARTRAVIARKTLRAPFKARVGIADVHEGQYLNEGTILTTLQGIDDASHVDFPVGQRIAEALKPGDVVELVSGTTASPARIVAVDARVDSVTRMGMVRAKIEGGAAPAPGASVRVRIAVGAPIPAVAVPVSALRKGPTGDHVFVIQPDAAGKLRAQPRAVQVGTVIGDEVLIVSGLKAGERVAASGSFKLREGLLVDVSAPPPSPAPVPNLR